MFLTEDDAIAPAALRVMAEAVHALPKRVVLLSWKVEDKPSAAAHRTSVTIDRDGEEYEGLTRVAIILGYRETPDVQHMMQRARVHDESDLADVNPERSMYYLSELTPLLSRRPGMFRWRKRLFMLLHQLQTDRIDQLRLPRDRTIVIGRQVDL